MAHGFGKPQVGWPQARWYWPHECQLGGSQAAGEGLQDQLLSTSSERIIVGNRGRLRQYKQGVAMPILPPSQNADQTEKRQAERAGRRRKRQEEGKEYSGQQRRPKGPRRDAEMLAQRPAQRSLEIRKTD